MTTEGNVTHRGNGQGNPFLTKGVSSPMSLGGNSPGKEGKPFPSLAGYEAIAHEFEAHQMTGAMRPTMRGRIRCVGCES